MTGGASLNCTPFLADNLFMPDHQDIHEART